MLAKIGASVYCWWECKMVQSYGNSMEVPQEVSTQINPMTQQFHSWVYIQRNWTELNTGSQQILTHILMCIAALLTRAQKVQTTKTLIARWWIKKMECYLHTVEYLLFNITYNVAVALERKDILTQVPTGMNLEDVMLMKSVSHKRKNTVW